VVIAYFDCFSGISGDMVLGALIDLGCEISFLKKELKKLGVTGYQVNVKESLKHDICATDVYISVDKNQPQRSFRDIVHLISESDLENRVKDKSCNIFLRLAEAEGKVHGVAINQVHFHEVGAVDSIIDIVGSVICLHELGVSEVFSSPLPLGSGFVVCQHGVLPVPAPATVELVNNIPTYHIDSGHEMVTPTGAAIITTIADSFGDRPIMDIIKIGYGAGKIQSKLPGVLRVYLGKKS
jgi:uncharacterized protein (TIGR00299 family) protein